MSMSQNILLIVYPLKNVKRNSLVVQWLGLSIFTARAWVQPRVRELRPCTSHSAAKKTPTKPKCHPATCMGPEVITLREAGQAEKDKCHMASLVRAILKQKTQRSLFTNQKDSQTRKTNLWPPKR